MSEIMSILGPGIYLSLSCTPFMDERSVYLKKEFIQDRHVVDRNIKLKVFEDAPTTTNVSIINLDDQST